MSFKQEEAAEVKNILKDSDSENTPETLVSVRGGGKTLIR